MSGFLPVNREGMLKLGWEKPDFVYVSGDGYVDHPSFGPAIITRLLESRGYKVAFLPQPDWKKDEELLQFGKPRLGFLISAGNMDSMVNHYSVARKHRKTDAYTPGGVMGKRPDRAVIVYGNWIRRVFPDSAIIAGGIEASLRRLAHYDYWADTLKKSVLLDSQADLISYGMGEHSIPEIADALASGIDIKDITWIRGTAYRAYREEDIEDAIMLPSWQQLEEDKKAYAESFNIQYKNTDPFSGKRLAEAYGRKLFVVQNPSALPLTETEMDDIYALPYMRTWHPMYDKDGGIPAFSEVKFSLISNRGCFGACSFCALTFHQGRILQTRSHESIIQEAKLLTGEPDFKGYIHDVGGPTADLRYPSCTKQLTKGCCTNRQCLFPEPCKQLRADHKDYLILLRKLRALPGVKKVFIRSGIRFDYVMADPSDEFLRELCQYHVSGQLKVAPEHVSDRVLKLMGKPENKVYQAFAEKYRRINEKLGKKQYLVPYLISSHPGAALSDAVALAEAVRDMGYMPEQVQDFYPTPATISTCMYYTGIDPRTGEAVAIVRDPHEKAMQRALIQYRDPKLYDLVREAIVKAGREDLIGYDKNCLIPPRPWKEDHFAGRKGGKKPAGADAKSGSIKSGAKGSGIKSGAKGSGIKSRAKAGADQFSGRKGERGSSAEERHAGPDKKLPQRTKRRAIRNVHKKKG